MGLRVSFRFTISSIIMAIFAIAFSAIVQADTSSGSPCSQPQTANFNNATLDATGNVTGTCTQTILTSGGTQGNCGFNRPQFCQALQTYDTCLQSQANIACQLSGGGADLTQCATNVGAAGCSATDISSASDITDMDAGSCQTKLATQMCCKSTDDKKIAQTDDEAAQKLEKQMSDLTNNDQQKLMQAQQQVTNLQNGLTNTLLQLSDQSTKLTEDENTQVAQLNSQIQQVQSDRAQLANQQQLAVQAYQAAMTQASADCRAMQFQYQTPGNAANLGNLSNALNSASKGGLMNSRCGVGQASLNTPWGQKYISEQSAAAQAYYAAIAALNKQNADDNQKVLSLSQQISTLGQNVMLENSQISLHKNAATQQTNTQIQQQMMQSQQVRLQDQQQAQSMQGQLQKAENSDKISNADYNKFGSLCNSSVQTLAGSCPSGGGGSSSSTTNTDSNVTVQNGLGAREALNEVNSQCTYFNGTGGQLPTGQTSTALWPGTDAAGSYNPITAAVTPATPASVPAAASK